MVVCQQARPGGEEGGVGSAARQKAGGRRRASASGLVEVAFAACIGIALDLDHFLAAGSLRLSKATSLAGRPWGHCVAALVVAVRRGTELPAVLRNIGGRALRVFFALKSLFECCAAGKACNIIRAAIVVFCRDILYVSWPTDATGHGASGNDR